MSLVFVLELSQWYREVYCHCRWYYCFHSLHFTRFSLVAAGASVISRLY